MSPTALERLTWVLIYSGLLMVCLGIFMMRRSSALGWGVVAAGAIGSATGVALIWVRSRRVTTLPDIAFRSHDTRT